MKKQVLHNPTETLTPQEIRCYATGQFERLSNERLELIKQAEAIDKEIAAKIWFFRMLIGENCDD